MLSDDSDETDDWLLRLVRDEGELDDLLDKLLSEDELWLDNVLGDDRLLKLPWLLCVLKLLALLKLLWLLRLEIDDRLLGLDGDEMLLWLDPLLDEDLLLELVLETLLFDEADDWLLRLLSLDAEDGELNELLELAEDRELLSDEAELTLD